MATRTTSWSRAARALLAAAFCLAQAAWAGTSGIVDTAFVKAAVGRGAILWDVRGWPAYRKGHLPGAVGIGSVSAMLRNAHDEDYVPLDRMIAILGEAGIDPAREVVVYGDKASPATYFALTTLQYLGAKQAHAYHGGIGDWVEAGLPLSAEYTPLPAVAIKPILDPTWLATTPHVLDRVKSGGAQFVDVRSPAEFAGIDIRALRGGHIPGALNIPYEMNWKDPEAQQKLARRQAKTTEGLNLKSADELKAVYKGLDPAKETIVYCQSGSRASFTAMVLREMGFKNVKLYDGSWLAYGNRMDAPAANETFLNVNSLLSRIDMLEAHVEGLEGELDRLRGGR